MPKPKDVGLIFDITVKNVNNETEKQLEFRIEPNGYCSVNVTSETTLKNMGQVISGNFGFIEPDVTETISVIWPTKSLYNRVGVCPIRIVSKAIGDKDRYIKEWIKFDTRFEILDPDSRTLRKKRTFVDCKNWDKDYFKNCSPVDCQERYFGQRNFYNKTSQKCEEVPRCNQSNQFYDIFANKCVNNKVASIEDDILYEINIEAFADNDMRENGEYPQPKKEMFEENVNEYFEYFKLNRFNNSTRKHKARNCWPFYKFPNWAKGLVKGILIVIATIALYCFICFSIFLIVIWISRKSLLANNPERKGPSIILTPQNLRSSAANLQIYTSSSLMSQR